MLGTMREKDGMKVLLDVGIHIGEPRLYLRYEDQMVLITSPSYDYDNDDGEFMLQVRNVSDEILEKSMETMRELADPNSIEPIEERGWIKFKLKKEYMDKLDRHTVLERDLRNKPHK